jgi:hypothetical protein
MSDMMKRLSRIAQTLRRTDKLSLADFVIAMPGHPVDGRELFYQPAENGPLMLVVTMEPIRAFIWQDVEQCRKWHVREWSLIGKEGDVSDFPTQPIAISHILTSLPARFPTDTFDAIRRNYLEREK